MAEQNLASLAPVDLSALGLQPSDLEEIQQVAARIQPGNPLSVAEFGREVSDQTSRYADQLLDQVKNRDLDEAGAKLNDVVSAAQAFNISGLIDSRSKIPLIGPLIDRLRIHGKRLVSEFDSTREQIEKLIAEVAQSQVRIGERNRGLAKMFEGVREEHRLLGIHIAAGKQRLVELKEQADVLRANVGNDPAKVQEVADFDALLANLDKRIGDLQALQLSALQSLPAIRIIQTNNQMLIDKFHTIRETTIPTWKRQFMLALALTEQRNAVDLANTIDDTTNDLLKRNAALLHQNSVDTARANQRLVIDVATLEQCQKSLIQTVQDVIRIQKEGIAQRVNAERAIQNMRESLVRELGNATARG